MKLKDALISELTVQEKDAKIFKKLKPELEQALDNIEMTFKKINEQMSSFNAPGAENAFRNAIKASINTPTGKFRPKLGKKELRQYERDNQ